jgi:hypothetical protein
MADSSIIGAPATAGGTDYTVQVEPGFPGASQEAQDMLAIVHVDETNNTNNRLIVHAAPIINAPRLAVIDWGTQVTVSQRIIFPNPTGNPDPNDQPSMVWYHITNPTSGWIVARMVDFEARRRTLSDYAYIVGGDVCHANLPTPPLERVWKVTVWSI